jgi:cyclase
MHRRSFLLNTSILAGASILTQKRALAQIFNVAEPKIKMLRGNVGIFTERGGTVGFLVTTEGIIVVDSQFPDTASNFISEVKKTNTSPFKFLLNTHHHGDHTAGNIAFKGLVENVFAHENCLANLKRVSQQQNTLEKQLLPDTTFTTEIKMKAGKEKIKGSHYGPAHTNGDAAYLFEDANIMHVGDLMFNRRHPYVDRSAGANMTSWIQVLDQLIKESKKDTLFIFGHSLEPGAETGTAEDLKKFQDYLGKVLQFAEKEIKSGKSKEEFLQNKSIPGVTEWQGDGIERPLTAAYEEFFTHEQKGG